ncbi:MAG: hypothetical protein H6721_16775 [Sandaracinus sp.]|nr:hypothetical protein [Sandaracinus sp.]MCB9633773.1 hypothetical protein [Sandaracinus sp.]
MRLAIGLVLGALVTACAGRAAVEPTTPTVGPFEGSLAELVPDDVHEVVVVHPSTLLSTESTTVLVDAVAPAPWRRALGDRTGVYAEDVSELVLARWDDGAWWALVRVPNADEVVRGAEVRMAPVELRSDEPFVRRVGFLGNERHELVALTPELLLVAQGRAGQVVQLLQALRDPRARAASRPPTWLEPSDAPAALVMPHPLNLPIDTPVGLLLARQTGLRLELRPHDDVIELRVQVDGELPDGAEANFRALFEALAASDLGRALGLPDATPTLRLRTLATGLEMQADLSPDAIASGIHLLFRAEIAEIVGNLGEEPGP